MVVAELPGYPGRRHTRQSCYVTAEFPRNIVTRIYQGLPGSGTAYGEQDLEMVLLRLGKTTCFNQSSVNVLEAQNCNSGVYAGILALQMPIEGPSTRPFIMLW